ADRQPTAEGRNPMCASARGKDIALMRGKATSSRTRGYSHGATITAMSISPRNGAAPPVCFAVKSIRLMRRPCVLACTILALGKNDGMDLPAQQINQTEIAYGVACGP